MNQKKLIVVEGSCDGIGKTTQFELLANRLRKEHYTIVTHHFPSYGTYQGNPVEKYLQGEYGQPKDLSPYFVNSLYALDRSITWYNDLKEKYDKGNLILLDRYTTSSIIYQSALIKDPNQKKYFIDYVCDFEYNKLGIPKPDKVIFLHAPFDMTTELRNNRKQNEGVSNDIHEQDLSFMRDVYKSALFVADYLGWDKIECSYNNQMRSIDDIHQDIYQLVKK